MKAPPLLDTHAWFWWLDGSGPLTRKVRTTLDAYPDTQRPALCAISLWEVALLVELGRVRLCQGFDEWIDVAAATETVQLLDVTPAVAKELLHLPRAFHRDPADRLIVATAREPHPARAVSARAPSPLTKKTAGIGWSSCHRGDSGNARPLIRVCSSGTEDSVRRHHDFTRSRSRSDRRGSRCPE